MIHSRCFRSCLLSLASVAALAAAEPKSAPAPDPATLPPPARAVVPKLSAKLVLDGVLDEPVWQKAALLGPFRRNTDGGPEPEGTTVRIWYDDTAIHLGWICRDSDIQATFTARDSKFWEEEVVEFFFTPSDLARYLELQWNPLGGEFDAVIVNDLDARGVSKKFTGDWSFTAKSMRSAVKVHGTVANSADRDEAWHVEVTIPFADLGYAPPRPGETWRANFYRFSRGKDQPVGQLAWSPTLLPGFHQPTRFGTLEFGR